MTVTLPHPEHDPMLRGCNSFQTPFSSRFRRELGQEVVPLFAIGESGMFPCSVYIRTGVPPNNDPYHSMYGLYTFKTGLGGRIVHYSGCWDFPLDEH